MGLTGGEARLLTPFPALGLSPSALPASPDRPERTVTISHKDRGLRPPLPSSQSLAERKACAWGPAVVGAQGHGVEARELECLILEEPERWKKKRPWHTFHQRWGAGRV